MGPITSIHSLCHESENRLLSHVEIRERYGVPCTFLETHGLQMGIPVHWRTMITADFQGASPPFLEVSLPSGKCIPILNASAKKLYSELILRGKPPPPAQRKWDLSIDIQDSAEWNSLYSVPFRVVRETKMQSLQYRILHRTITCNCLLYRWRLRDDDTCNFCDRKDSLEHFLFSCTICREFWIQVKRWLYTASRISLNAIALKEFIVGIPREFPNASVVNYILIWIKYFIRKQKLFSGGVLNLQAWIRELRLKLLVERRICEAEGKLEKFARWRILLRATDNHGTPPPPPQ